jgi:hypothetical protein
LSPKPIGSGGRTGGRDMAAVGAGGRSAGVRRGRAGGRGGEEARRRGGSVVRDCGVCGVRDGGAGRRRALAWTPISYARAACGASGAESSRRSAGRLPAVRGPRSAARQGTPRAWRRHSLKYLVQPPRSVLPCKELSAPSFRRAGADAPSDRGWCRLRCGRFSSSLRQGDGR